MESGGGVSVKTADIPSPLGSLLSSIGQLLLLGLEWILAHCPGFAVASGAGAPVDSGKRLIMKVILFPVKFDKFTGFFDKFLKIIFSVNDCNKKSCHMNMSENTQIRRQKKFFGSRAFARNCPQKGASQSLLPQSGLRILDGRPPNSRSTS